MLRNRQKITLTITASLGELLRCGAIRYIEYLHAPRLESHPKSIRTCVKVIFFRSLRPQRTVIITIALLLLLGSLFSGAYLSQRPTPATPPSQSQNADSVIFTLEPSQKNPAPGETVTVSLYTQAPAATEVRSLAAYLKYSPSIEIVADGVSRSTQGLFADWDYIKTKNNTADSRVEILAAYQPLDANPNPDGYLRDSPSLFATIKLRWLGGGPAILKLITDPATSGAKDPAGNDVPLAPLSLTI